MSQRPQLWDYRTILPCLVLYIRAGDLNSGLTKVPLHPFKLTFSSKEPLLCVFGGWGEANEIIINNKQE